MTKVLTFCKKF